MADVATIRTKFEALRPFLDERRRRLWAAAEAVALGRGGVTAVATATGLRRNTIHTGIDELRGARWRHRCPTAACVLRAAGARR